MTVTNFSLLCGGKDKISLTQRIIFFMNIFIRTCIEAIDLYVRKRIYALAFMHGCSFAGLFISTKKR